MGKNLKQVAASCPPPTPPLLYCSPADCRSPAHSIASLHGSSTGESRAQPNGIEVEVNFPQFTGVSAAAHKAVVYRSAYRYFKQIYRIE
ncbi:hypothetical protein L1987_45871 [Smallanthus sonchifolius]|uniref:Uncharacterized protein n=1 Tax=Smallanthus sonchifolius TaxID=185202 RepID=A0ACB9FY24_9ASTR|nr:hypothetical protein L1987_45871 [Smallanthus sonchifolius]